MPLGPIGRTLRGFILSRNKYMSPALSKCRGFFVENDPSPWQIIYTY